MKLIREPKKIFAYKTQVSTEKSLEEIRKMLNKYECRGFGFIENPENPKEKVVMFQIPMKNGSYSSIRMAIPEVWVKLRTKEKYLEKVSYRYLVLLLKAKLNQVELGEPIEEVFLLDMITQDGKKMRELIIKDYPLLTQGNE